MSPNDDGMDGWRDGVSPIQRCDLAHLPCRFNIAFGFYSRSVINSSRDWVILHCVYVLKHDPMKLNDVKSRFLHLDLCTICLSSICRFIFH